MAELTKFLTDKGGKQEEGSGEGGEGAEKEKPASKKTSRVR